MQGHHGHDEYGGDKEEKLSLTQDGMCQAGYIM